MEICINFLKISDISFYLLVIIKKRNNIRRYHYLILSRLMNCFTFYKKLLEFKGF